MIDRRIKFWPSLLNCRNLRRAKPETPGQKLLLTQPAITKILKELEQTVGASLLVRNRAGVALTKPGEVFLHFAGMSLASLQQGLTGIGQSARVPDGPVAGRGAGPGDWPAEPARYHAGRFQCQL